MRCEDLREKAADYLAGELDEESLARLRAHLAECPSCREEMESLSLIWTKLGVLPNEQPSPALRSRFYDMLETHKKDLREGREKRGWGRAISQWLAGRLPGKPAFQLGLALALIAIGLGGGLLLGVRPRSAARAEVAGLKGEVDDMRRIVAISLLRQASPSDRLMGVSWSARIDRPGDDIIAALFETLNEDPNVNVRLAAADALYLFQDHPEVKKGLADSLSKQTSPLVQLSVINLLVEIRERRAVEALERLIRDEKLNPKVKKRAELGLVQLS
jgi:hypothetical protein